MSAGRARPVVFLSDYGLEDEFVGICRAVVARISPGSPVIDLTHAVAPQDVLRGALLLARAVPYLPHEAVVLAVVDPGVGTARRPVALETASGPALVGPDNGLLSLAWAEAGGAVRAVEIASPEVILPPVSATFHGRDVFAPAAAHLAAGQPLAALGPPVDPSTLVALAAPEPLVEPGRVRAEVLLIDRFGNAELSARPTHLVRAGLADAARLAVEAGGRTVAARRGATFADVGEGEAAVIEDSAGYLALVVNRGNAARAFGLALGHPVALGAPE